jgi:hypothetical protein
MTNTYIIDANLNRCADFIRYLDETGFEYRYTTKDETIRFIIKATAEEWRYIKNAKETFA